MDKILVVDVMTREPISAKPGDTLAECAKKMVRKKVGSLLLVENKKLVGFISQKDILWALIKKSKTDLSKIRAIDLSPKKIAVIRPDSSIRDAVEKMKKLQFERLPVVDKGNLVGIVTLRDIIGFHPDVYPELEEFIEIREEQEKLNRIKKMKDLAVTEDGVCEECGGRASLYRIHGMLVCESCRSSI